MTDLILKICSMPKDFHSCNKSMSQLFNETDYIKNKAFVSKELLMSYLADNPDLITDWENYSSDKRVSQGWYFLKENTKWIVGYASAPSQEQKFSFESDIEACTEFILRELKEFTENAPRI